MSKFLKLLILIIVVFPLFGAGCVLKLNNTKAGGIYKSFDKIESWEQKVFVSKVKRRVTTIAGVSTRQLKFDPQNSQTLYLITVANGMYVSYNGGEQWIPLFSTTGSFEDLAIDPKERNVLYTARGNQIFKSTDNGGQWKMIYLEALAEKSVKSLAVDLIDNKIIYAGMSDGRLLRSLDAGQSWENWMEASFAGKNLSKIMINPKSPQWLFLVTPSNGIFRGDREGSEWVNITVNNDTKKLKGINNFKTMFFDEGQTFGLFLATQYGLLKSSDAGDNWESIPLLGASGSYNIMSLAVNPQNNKEIYYGTTNALYKTEDGGQTWVTKKMPASGGAGALLLKPEDPKILYLGIKVLEK